MVSFVLWFHHHQLNHAHRCRFIPRVPAPPPETPPARYIWLLSLAYKISEKHIRVFPGSFLIACLLPGEHELRLDTQRVDCFEGNAGHWPESIAAINSNLPPINSTLSAQLLANKPHFFGINHYTSKCALAHSWSMQSGGRYQPFPV